MTTVLPNALGFLQSSQLTDFTVKCEEFEWKVHGIILASGSRFFERAFCGNFREATNKVIELPDDKSEMVARMLLCLYTSSYPDLFSNRKVYGPSRLREFKRKGHPAFKASQFEYEKNTLMVHSEMYAMAEKYDMPGLQAVCVAKFAISQYPQQSELQNLVKVLSHVYTSTPPSRTPLRLKAAALVQETYSQIMHKASLKAPLGAACIENGQLGWDVLSNLFNRRTLQCPECPELSPFEPFDDDFRFRTVCVCGLTKLCGSLACSRLVEEKWPCDDCGGGNVGNLRVMER